MTKRFSTYKILLKVLIVIRWRTICVSLSFFYFSCFRVFCCCWWVLHRRIVGCRFHQRISDLFDNQIEYLPDTVFDSLENLINLWVIISISLEPAYPALYALMVSNISCADEVHDISHLFVVCWFYASLSTSRKIHKNKLKVLDEKIFIANINLETLQVFPPLFLLLSNAWRLKTKVNSWYLDWIRDLSNNELREVPTGVFRTLRRLTVLHLSSNKLERLDEILLKGLNQLEDVDISRNELTELPPLLLDGINGTVVILTDQIYWLYLTTCLFLFQ